MIGLDTNVIVRYLTHDDAAQAAAAVRVIDSLTFDQTAAGAAGMKLLR